MTMRTLLILMFCVGFNSLSYAQEQSMEAGMFIGVSNYLGDLQQVRFEKDELHLAMGAFIRANLSRHFAVKAHFYKGHISGTDEHYEGLLVRERNLHFRSPLYEIGLQGELTFLNFGERQQRIAAPYCFLGVAGFFFNPQARYQGEWIDLQPLGTEGQGLPEYPDRERYSLRQLSIPFGIGFNVWVGQNTNLGFEIGFRKTFTDYLDDISTTYPDLEVLAESNPVAAALSYRTPEYTPDAAPNPMGQLRGSSGKDIYFFGGITISTVIDRQYKSDPVYRGPKR